MVEAVSRQEVFKSLFNWLQTLPENSINLHKMQNPRILALRIKFLIPARETAYLPGSGLGSDTLKGYIDLSSYNTGEVKDFSVEERKIWIRTESAESPVKPSFFIPYTE